MDVISLFSFSQEGYVGKGKKVSLANKYGVVYLQGFTKLYKCNKNKKE